MADRALSLDTIRAASPRVYQVAVRTPLVPLDPTEPRGAADVYLKLENLQPTGSFKIRGAANAAGALAPEAVRDGVWTVSAGNAAQGVAFAARRLGLRCGILLIDTAPDTKRRAIERLGADLVPASYDECWTAVEAHASARMTGTLIHPFDDDAFISGNGTIGLELAEELPDVDAVVVAVGGGGLLAGIGTALRALKPGIRIYAAEPETAAPVKASLEAGGPSRFEGWRASFVDGAGGRSVLPSMWPLLARLVTDSIVVPLEDVARAMRLVAERRRVLAEGAAACAVAAALSGRAGRGRIVAVVSGGNIDLSTFCRVTGNP